MYIRLIEYTKMNKQIIFWVFFCLLCNACNNSAKSKKIDELLILANASDSIKDLSASIKYYTEILTLDSTNLMAINNRGRAYIWHGQIGLGLADYDKAIKLYPDEGSYYRRGIMHLYLSHFENATADFFQSVALNPNFSNGYYGLAQLLAAQGQIDSADYYCQKADKLLYIAESSHQVRYIIFEKQGNYHAAINELTERLKIDSSNEDVFNNIGYLKNKLREYSLALEYFDRATKINPKIAYPYNNKAYALLKLNQIDLALINVNKSIQLDDKNAHAYKTRAEIFLALGHTEKSCVDLLKGIELSNDTDLIKDLQLLKKINCKE